MVAENGTGELCAVDLGGPSEKPTTNTCWSQRHNGSSLEIPRAPWIWMAFITTSWSTSAAAILHAAISLRAPSVVCWSMSQAAWSTSSRNCWICIYESAM